MPHQLNAPPDAPASARSLIAAAQWLGQRVAGWEASVKWSLAASPAWSAESASTLAQSRVAARAPAMAEQPDDERRVLGFSVDGLSEAGLDRLLEIIGAPPAALEELRGLLPKANFGYLATERDGAKAYLEFPVRLSETDAAGRVRWSPPGLWAHACKWRPGQPGLRRTQYWLVPGATMIGFLDRLRADDPGHPLIGMAEVLVGRRPRAAAELDAVTLYEVKHEDGTCAWDFNVYGFELELDAELAHALGWPRSTWPGVVGPLGHIAAGRDGKGLAYRSLYWRAGS
jgi:hypothetical protein